MSDNKKTNGDKTMNVTENKKTQKAKKDAESAGKEIVAISMYPQEIFEIEQRVYEESVRTGYTIDRSAFIRKVLIEAMKLTNGAPPPKPPVKQNGATETDTKTLGA
jgi:hypothetical protein